LATPSNRFNKVEQADPHAVTVALRDVAGRASGEVLGPDGETRLRFGEDGTLSPHQALAVGCHLANQLDRAVVVIDRDGLWQPAWGRLDPA
jgi:hypothetical protein